LVSALLKPVTFGKELVALDPANKPPLVAVVLFATVRAEKKDLKKILDLSTGSDAQWNETHVKGFWS